MSSVFPGSFREISRVFQESFKGVLTKIEGGFRSFKGVQGYLKEVENMCLGGFNGVSRKFQ